MLIQTNIHRKMKTKKYLGYRKYFVLLLLLWRWRLQKGFNKERERTTMTDIDYTVDSHTVKIKEGRHNIFIFFCIWIGLKFHQNEKLIMLLKIWLWVAWLLNFIGTANLYHWISIRFQRKADGEKIYDKYFGRCLNNVTVIVFDV